MKLFDDNEIQADSLKAIYEVKKNKSISGDKVLVELIFLKKEPVKAIIIVRIKYPEVHY